MTSETDRQAYYGSTTQPWDLIKALGMAPDFAAGNVMKYVGRYRAKNGLDDLKKARWYLDRLIELKEAEHDQ
jgi:phage terminase large subunit-like protein